MRAARIKPVDQPAVYHCTSRTIGGRFLFDHAERDYFQELLWPMAGFCGVQIITHAILSNHFHLLVRTPGTIEIDDRELARRVALIYPEKNRLRRAVTRDMERKGSLSASLRNDLLRRMGDVSMFMKEFKQRFTTWYNRKNDHFGTIWSERYGCTLVEDEPLSVRKVAAYIDLNPVRAGLVSDPADYAHCGYALAMRGHEEARRGLEGYLPGENWEQKAEQYREYLFCLSAEPGHSDKKGPSREEILEKLKKGPVEMSELLRVRVGYFTRGKVMGRREYVDGMFERFRGRFGKRRKEGALEMEGADWGGMMVLGILRGKVFG